MWVFAAQLLVELLGQDSARDMLRENREKYDMEQRQPIAGLTVSGDWRIGDL